MQISRSDLRARMAMHSDGELYLIARSTDHVFTEIAREEARSELERRESTVRVHYEGANGESRQADAISETRVFVLVQRVRGWWYRLVPDDVPSGVREMFSVGIAAAIPGVLTILIGVGEYLLKHTAARTLAYMATGEGAFSIALAIAGAVLAWGIARKRAYAQYLAALVVVACAGLAIVSALTSKTLILNELAAIGVGTFATVKYLLWGREATEYYRHLRAAPLAVDQHGRISAERAA